MFSSRYSEMEMKQWDDACACQENAANDAPRHNAARATMAKGQAEKKMSRTAFTATQAQSPKYDDWAGECLFDCYNG